MGWGAWTEVGVVGTRGGGNTGGLWTEIGDDECLRVRWRFE